MPTLNNRLYLGSAEVSSLVLSGVAVYSSGPRVGSVSVSGGGLGLFEEGDTVTLTASFSGNATDVEWSWEVPAGSSVVDSGTNVLSFTATSNDGGFYTATAVSSLSSDSPAVGLTNVSVSSPVSQTLGTVSVVGGGTRSVGDFVTLSATFSGNAAGATWSWEVPAGSSVVDSGTNVLSFTATSADTGTFTVTATSVTASDSPVAGNTSVLVESSVLGAPSPSLYLPMRTDLLDVSDNTYSNTSGSVPVIDAEEESPIGAGCADFTASSNQYLQFADDAGLDPGTEDFFVSVWAYSRTSGNTTDYPAVLAKGSYQSSTGAWSIYNNRANVNGVNFAYGNPWVEGTLFTGGAAFPGGSWRHIYIQRSLNTLSLYTNGTLRASLDVTGVEFSSSHVLRVGNDLSGTNPWHGYLQDLVFCVGSVLTPAQIAALQTQPYSDILASEPPPPSITVGTVSVTGAGVFDLGDTVTLTASFSGNATDVEWSWEVPAGSSVVDSGTNVLSFTATSADTGTFTVTATSVTASDSPNTGFASVSAGSLVPLSLPGWNLTSSDIGLVGAGVDRRLTSEGGDLTLYTGPLVIPANTTLDRYLFRGPVRIINPNVRIQRSLFAPLGGVGIPLIECRNRDIWVPSAYPSVVSDCEITGEFTATQEQRAFLSGWWGPGTLQRTYVHRLGGGIACYGVGTELDILIEDNVIGDPAATGDYNLATNPSGSFTNDMQGWGPWQTTGNHSSCGTFRDFSLATRPDRVAIVRRNRFFDTGPNASGPFTLYGQEGRIDGNIFFEQNLFSGNNWKVNIAPNNPNPIANLSFIDNRFERNPDPTSFHPGWVSQGVPGMVFSNNYVLDRSQAQERGSLITV